MQTKKWEIKKLIDVADSKTKWSFTGGPFGSNLKASDYTKKGVRIIQLQNIGDGEFNDDYKIYTSESKADELLSCNIYPNDIILSKMGDPVARACKIPPTEERFVMSSDGIRLKVNTEEYNPDFVLNYINYDLFRNTAIEKAIGSTRKRIGLDDLKSIPFPKPSLDEQNKIAEILNIADKTITQTQKLISKKILKKKALMQNLLKGKIRFKEFKDDWVETTLGEVAEFENGKAHENCISEKGTYIVVNSKFVSKEGKEFKRSNMNLSPLFINDIVMVMSDIPNGKALAKCFVIKENNKYTLNQRICALRTNTSSPLFIYYLINRNSYFLEFDSGVGQTNLKKEEVLSCPLLIPSLKEQHKISSVLTMVDEEIQKMKLQLEKLKLQKKGLMQLLLTGKVRVKI